MVFTLCRRMFINASLIQCISYTKPTSDDNDCAEYGVKIRFALGFVRLAESVTKTGSSLDRRTKI